ncbi:MAG TPA: class I SAM-dependent methyltransferase [Acidimicrobiales bacterium]|nr:class I SAM-dependent methyltransferase [Acidimicrobiales bacterium]
MSLAAAPAEEVLAESYGDTADPVSLREEAGQVETARRALAVAERFVTPGRLADLGCWTGSLLVAARARGWDVTGVEPSRWASERARARGLDVVTADLHDLALPRGVFRLVAMCDVIEHLVDPGAALATVRELLDPQGALLLTLPDAGSRVARVLGRRWWSVLPMHVQYFSRASLTELLRRHGFDVRLVTTHAKVFSLRYYVERLGGYSDAVARAAVGAVTRFGWAERLVAPDFRDRMLVVATPTAADAAA